MINCAERKVRTNCKTMRKEENLRCMQNHRKENINMYRYCNDTNDAKMFVRNCNNPFNFAPLLFCYKMQTRPTVESAWTLDTSMLR